MSNRLTLAPPISWGMTDEDLAAAPLSFSADVLKGRVCLVSGGGSGMGRAIAYVLVRLGAEVIICGRREEKLAETAAGIKRLLHKEIMAQSMTIREPEQVNDLFDAAVQRYGH